MYSPHSSPDTGSLPCLCCLSTLRSPFISFSLESHLPPQSAWTFSWSTRVPVFLTQDPSRANSGKSFYSANTVVLCVPWFLYSEFYHVYLLVSLSLLQLKFPEEKNNILFIFESYLLHLLQRTLQLFVEQLTKKNMSERKSRIQFLYFVVQMICMET